jgi:hypothetical protein
MNVWRENFVGLLPQWFQINTCRYLMPGSSEEVIGSFWEQICKGWIKSNGNISVVLKWLYYLQWTHFHSFNIIIPHLYHLLPDLLKVSYTISASTSVDVQHWPPYSTNNRFSCVVTQTVNAAYSCNCLCNHICPSLREWDDTCWQWKNSYCWYCQGSPSLQAMGGTGTSAILIRFESMRLWSLCQNERTTARETLEHGWLFIP